MLKFVRAAAFAGATLLMAHGAYADTVIKACLLYTSYVNRQRRQQDPLAARLQLLTTN